VGIKREDVLERYCGFSGRMLGNDTRFFIWRSVNRGVSSKLGTLLFYEKLWWVKEGDFLEDLRGTFDIESLKSFGMEVDMYGKITF
jgi:hypothetical protein